MCGRLDIKIIKIYCMKSKLIDVSVCMYVVNTLLVLPGSLGQAYHLPLYLNGANHFAPYTGHTTDSMGIGTNQKVK